MAQGVAGSNPVTYPIPNPHANSGSNEPQTHEGSYFSEAEARVSPSEMLDFLKYLQKYAHVQPRTYWYEIPFFRIIKNARQQFCLGNRPEDLEYIPVIEKRAWERHLAHLKRLERFPIDKAEYYQRLKESRAVNSVRGLSEITGENWSYIAKILRTLELPESIKDFLRNNKNNSDIIQFFHLRRLLDIVRQGDERAQLGRFRELVEEFEESKLGGWIK